MKPKYSKNDDGSMKPFASRATFSVNLAAGSPNRFLTKAFMSE